MVPDLHVVLAHLPRMGYTQLFALGTGPRPRKPQISFLFHIALAEIKQGEAENVQFGRGKLWDGKTWIQPLRDLRQRRSRL